VPPRSPVWKRNGPDIWVGTGWRNYDEHCRRCGKLPISTNDRTTIERAPRSAEKRSPGVSTRRSRSPFFPAPRRTVMPDGRLETIEASSRPLPYPNDPARRRRSSPVTSARTWCLVRVGDFSEQVQRLP
jgi:hypothetical protein